MDDVAFMVVGEDFADTHYKLKRLMTKANSILHWARDHNCEFGIDKFQLLDLS